MQMRLTVNNFRSYEERTWELPDESLVLIQGRSGAGKSTIFQAIYWLLYGSDRVKKFRPHGASGYTWVSMELSGISIRRDTKPSRTTFSDGNLLLEGDEAEAEIVKRFGPPDYWLATSYIRQGQRCSLLSSSSSERLDILNRLSFSNDNPDEIIERIEQRLTKELTLLSHEQEVYQRELDEVKDSEPINPQATPDSVAELSKEIDILDAEVTDLQQRHERYLANSQLRGELTARLNDVEQQLAELPEIDETLPERVERLRISHQQHLSYLRDMDRVKGIRERLEKLPPDRWVEDIDKAIAEWAIREKGVEVCQRWNIPYDSEEIDKRLDRLQHREAYRLYKKRLERAQEIDRELASLPEGTLEEKELRNLERLHEQHCRSLELCRAWNVEPDNVADRLATLDELIDRAKRAHEAKQLFDKATKLDREIEQLEARIAKLPLTVIPEDKSPQLEEKKKQLEIAKRSLDILTCPHCLGSVRYHERRLIPQQERPIDPAQYKRLEEEVDRLRQEVAKRNSALWEKETVEAKRTPLIKELERVKAIRSAYGSVEEPPVYDLDKLTKERTDLARVALSPVDIETARGQARRLELQTERDNLDLTPVPEVDLTTAEQEYRELSKVQVVSLDYDPRPIKERRQLQEELAKLTIEDSEDTSELPRLEERLAIENEAKPKRTKLLAERDALRLSIDKILLEPVEEKLISTKLKLEETKQRHKLDDYSVKMIEYNNYLREKGERLEEYKRSIEGLTNLKDIAQRVRYELLERVIATINSKMEEVLGFLFEDPITVSLSLYREKRNKELKPQVNLAISYKGGDYDNIGQLSGGEGDRVSLALIIALSYISGSPLLLLDETLSSLDGTYREACTKALRLLSDKLVLVISHEDVEGNYDSSINL
jgi:exonuclease SbcC